MEVNKIISILDENFLSEIEELKIEKDLFLVRFNFDFDEDVLKAAKSYSNEESDYEEESNEWYKEYLIPYLYEYGNDEVLDVIEEIIEELEIEGEIMAFQMQPSNVESMQLMGLFTSGEKEVSIEDVAKDFIF
ncbi:hypothetical protein [Clostridium sp.]|uniref:hypothetical protein n=1 Tax=Clostridium sp. TaxID=1506 RepID=UPI00262A0A60|nr:hypothetical protein [Clostridium sp.]